MNSSALDVAAYFSRIGYRGTGASSQDLLACLHALHPLAIPFENLSSWSGTAPELSIEALQHKMLGQNRGGYCFEHNLLFAHVLQALGFDVKGLAARVLWNNAAAPETLAKTHMLLLVSLAGEDFIADVGFGGLTMTAPLRLQANLEQSSSHETFRLLRQGSVYGLEVKLGQEWKAMYQFDLHEHLLPDYQAMNWFVATHPESRFRKHLIAARVGEDGRHALQDDRYTKRSRDGRAEQEIITSPERLGEILAQVFHIDYRSVPGFEQRLPSLFARS